MREREKNEKEKGRKKRSQRERKKKKEKRKCFFNERRERSLIIYIYIQLLTTMHSHLKNFSYSTIIAACIFSVSGAKNSNIAIQHHYCGCTYLLFIATCHTENCHIKCKVVLFALVLLVSIMDSYKFSLDHETKFWVGLILTCLQKAF